MSSNHQNLPETAQTGGRQTMSSWSRVIETTDAIPEAFRAVVTPQLQSLAEFPHMVLAPPLDKFLRRTAPKLVFESHETLHIFEQTSREVTHKSFPYRDLALVEVGVILLNSWIRLCGLSSEGKMEQAIIEYNTASERHYAPFVTKMRPRVNENINPKIEQAKFDFLAQLDFKFMNYGRASLVPGEKVLQVIFEPEINETVWHFLGWKIQRAVSMAQLTILTDQELILIRDDERVKKIKGKRYGGVWQYIPRNAIHSAVITPQNQDRYALTLQLASGDSIQSLYAAPNKEKLETLHQELAG
jgi:hypothetical protein